MKAVMHYLFLVGLPVFGVFGLLRIGEGITPPVSVGGNWQLDLSSPAAQRFVGTCASWSAWLGEPRLTISQSGHRLILKFNNSEKTTLNGGLDALAISGAATGLTLQLHVDRQVEPDRLVGSLSADGCRPVLPLIATRLPMFQAVKGGH